MAEKKESNQLGARLDPAVLKWIRDTAEEMKISQGELVGEMQKSFLESEATQRYPQWAAQIRDVNYWARSLVSAYMAQVDHGNEADKLAREEVQKLLQRKDNLIEDQMKTIGMLRTEISALGNAEKKANELQRELETARAQAKASEADSKQHLQDLRATIDSLLDDKKRLEAEVRICMERTSAMEAAMTSFDAMRAERDAATARIDEEKKATQIAKVQASEATKKCDILNKALHEALIHKAASEAEVNSLRQFRDANGKLYEIIGEQKAIIAMLEEKITPSEQEVQMD